MSALLFEARLRRAFDEKAINARQFTLVSQVLQASGGVPLDALRRAPWFESLYLKLNDKTRTRDLVKLRELGFLHQDEQKRLWPGVSAKPASGAL